MARLTSRWKALRAAARARWRARRIAATNRAAASTCFYCAVRFTPAGPDHRTVDHRVPRSRGGSDALGNLVFACYSCNQRKRDRLEEDFLASSWLANRREAVAEARIDADERRASRHAAPSSTVEHRTSDEVTPPPD